MNRLKELLPHSLFLGTCAVLLGTLIRFNLPLSIFIFSSTSAGYLFLRKKSLPIFEHTYFWIAFFSLLISAFFSFLTLPTSAKAMAVFTGALTLLYAQENNFSLRKYTLLKPAVIGVCWALNTAVISYDNPVFFIPNDHSVLWIIIHIFILTYLLSLLYDLRDVEHGLDDTHVFQTVFGKKATQWFVFITLNATTVFSFLWSEDFVSSLAFFITSIYTVVLIEKADPTKMNRYTWLVDFAFILYWASALLGRLFLENFV